MSKTTKLEWEKMPVRETMLGTQGGNQILRGDGFYISFQDWSSKNKGKGIFEELNVLLTGDTTQDTETALFVEETQKWHILWGDHRKAYEKAFPSLEKCMAVYKSLKKEFHNDKWSTD